MVILLPIAAITYAILIQAILAESFLSRGWTEVTTEDEGSDSLRNPLDPGIRSSSYVSIDRKLSAETKKCPFCAEKIKFDAIKCKHCKSDLESESALDTMTGVPK